MTATDDVDLTASDITWNIEPLLIDPGVAAPGLDALLDRADELAGELDPVRGRVASLTTDELIAHLQTTSQLHELVGRAANYSSLQFAADTTDPAHGALLQQVQERATAISTRLLFFDLEWAELDDEAADAHLAHPDIGFARHHLAGVRRYRPYLLSEAEEKIVVEKDVTGASAWGRLFDELTSAITIKLPGEDGPVPLEAGLSLLADPDASARQQAAAAITQGLEPGLRTRAYVFNTLLADKATDDRLRGYPSWISSRNLANEASDQSVEALVDAVAGRYEIARRWYRLKAEILGVERLADYDRLASVAESERSVMWSEARDLVLDAYQSFSPELADGARLFFDEGWIDAPTRPGKRPGAFCAYTVPSHHPYVFMNWTGRSGDVLTLAHELGHGLHAHLARPQGVFHQFTPLTLAETASVFGETVTFGRLLDATDDPGERLALLAQSIEGSIGTVFRQTAMNRFENQIHTERREVGELSVDRLNELWTATQSDLLGDAVEITEGYRTWWSYIPHFVRTPGYVYAYAYGQLLALSVYRRYEEQGPDFVPRYLDLLRAGGSRPPNELGQMVDCDLDDPGFWDLGLDLIEQQLQAAEAAAVAAGRVEPS
ncbi:MAG: M3 family oligoendopeptidase [Actinomycetia bacterium]|nr:M3 family oligoendopeptidase [Actinomycetes bacterium]